MAETAVKPLVSIIVPVYNVESYLAECLESLIMQSFHAIEIVCVDDGSTDSSPMILQSYAAEDDRIRVITQENGGVSRARNRGIEAARGEYVLFVDSDDYIALDTCEVLLEAALRDEADIVVFGGKTFPTVKWKDNSFAQRDVVYGPGKSIDALVFEPGSRPLMCNKMYSRALLESCGARFNEEISLGEDQAFQFYVFPHAGTVSYVSDVLYFYRGRSESLVGQSDEDLDDKSRKHLVLVEYIVDTWRDLGLLSERPNDLLSWIADFLYDSMQFTSFDVRCEVSAQLRSLVQESFDVRTIGMIDATLRRKLDFMMDSCIAAEEPPLVTFVVFDQMGERLKSETLQELLWQHEQRIECLVSEACVTEKVADVINKDRRCRIENLSTIGEVARLSAGRFVVPLSCNCRFVSYAASEIMAFARAADSKLRESKRVVAEAAALAGSSPASEVDVVLFGDLRESLRCEDAFEACQPNNAHPLASANVHRLDDVRSRVFCIASLALGNKAFRTGFLQKCSEQLGESPASLVTSWLGLIAQQADVIVTAPASFVAYSETTYDQDALGADAPERRLKGLLDELAGFGEGLDDGERPGYRAALARYCLTLDDVVSDMAVYEQVHDALADCMRQCTADLSTCEAPLFLTQADAEQARGLMDDPAREHFEDKARLLLRRAHAESLALLNDANRLRGENEGLASRIDLFYKSATYRVGQVVTKPARKLYYLAKSVRRG